MEVADDWIVSDKKVKSSDNSFVIDPNLLFKKMTMTSITV